jgi:hypothetical protein
VDRVDAQTDQLHAALIEFCLIPREGGEFRRAHGRKIGRVAEEHNPLALEIAQLQNTVRGYGLKIRRLFVDLDEARALVAAAAFFLFAHSSPPIHV